MDICPICQQANNCMVNNVSCWCYEFKISPQVQTYLSKKAIQSSCVCKGCLSQLEKQLNLSTEK